MNILRQSGPDLAQTLIQIALSNPNLSAVLEKAPELDLPNWYVGAGCIAQTYWNQVHGFPLSENITDIDLVYFDPADISYEAEDRHIQRANDLFRKVEIPVDLKNQARVHLWYEKHFGVPIEPYPSVEAAIDTWPTTATAVAITSNGSMEGSTEGSTYRVYAPYGLDDLFNLVIRPNKIQITEEIYHAKVSRWQHHWPRLTILSW